MRRPKLPEHPRRPRCSLQYERPRNPLGPQALRDYRDLFVWHARLAVSYRNRWRAERDYRTALEAFWAENETIPQPLPKDLPAAVSESPRTILQTLLDPDLPDRLAAYYALLTKAYGHFQYARVHLGLPNGTSARSKRTRQKTRRIRLRRRLRWRSYYLERLRAQSSSARRKSPARIDRP